MWSTILAHWSLLSAAWALDMNIPSGFKLGVASAAYQTEGAWNYSDKGLSIWDQYMHSRLVPYYGDTGDVACDGYHQWRRDVELLAELEVDFYRFSIAWTRILPTGFTNRISSEGIKHYSDLIDALLERGIEPIVTMYHFDLPQKLQDYGGWLNPLITDWFTDYAKILYENYGDRVKTWLTINEPVVICDVTYNGGVMAPGILDPDRASYLCTKNVLLAHAKAWRTYDELYKPIYHGKVSFSNHYFWFEGLTEADNELAELVLQYAGNRFDHAVYSETGGWPPVIEQYVAEKSKKEGYTRSKLPKFTQNEIDLIKGTYDFYALNHYTSRTVRSALPGEDLRPFLLGDCPELNAKISFRKEWQPEGSAIFAINPKGLRLTLSWLKKSYGDIEIFITENGFTNSRFDLQDDNRIRYIRDYMEQVLLSIQEDHVNVTGYTYWTLMDNFEWVADGYKNRFGLIQVDFNDPMRTRTPRKSARYYRTLIRNRSLDVPLHPDGWADEYQAHQLHNHAAPPLLLSAYCILGLVVFICKIM